MAIRFQCASCKQPIEIDDAWASRAVLCPFCRTTVGAPQSSTLTDLADVPSASPVGGSIANAGTHLAGRAGRSGQGNAVAVVAFVLVWVAILFGVLGMALAASHSLEMQEFAQRIETANEQSKPSTQAMMEYLNEHGGVYPTWLMACSIAVMAAGGSLLAAMVCAVIGLFRRARRGFAVAALCIGSALVGLVVVVTLIGAA